MWYFGLVLSSLNAGIAFASEEELPATLLFGPNKASE